MKSFLLFLFSLLISFSCAAQENGWYDGFYVSLQQDTVDGVFNFDKTPKNVIRYKTSIKGKEIRELSPEEVLAITCNNGIYFTTTKVRFLDIKETIFIEKVISGSINLYRGHSKSSGKLFFIETADQEGLVSVNGKSPDAFFRNYFKDCTISGKVKFEFDSIKRAIQEVHKCRNNGEPPLILSPEEKPSFAIGAKATINTYRPEMEGYFWIRGNYLRKTSEGFGLSAKLQLGRKIGLISGLEYQRKIFQTDSLDKAFPKYQRIPNPGNPYFPFVSVETLFFYRYALRSDFHFLRVPFGIEYYFSSHTNNSVVLSFGGSFKYLFSWKMKGNNLRAIRMESENPDVPPIEFGDVHLEFDFNSLIFPDFYAGIGYSTKLSSKSEMVFFLNYSKQKEDLLLGVNEISGYNATMYSDVFQASLTYYFYSKKFK